jgi:uncharacterized protein
MRVHSNFAEYAPFTLLPMALAESLNSWTWLMHLTGLMLLAGRVTHAYGVSQPRENFRFRVVGMAMTHIAIGLAAATCVYEAVVR